MIFAEAVTFDPGLVVALFVGFLLACAAALAVVVVGVVAGHCHGRDLTNRRAATAWRTCLGIEATVVTLLVIGGAPLQLTVIGLAAPGATWLSRLLGQRSSGRHSAQRP